MKISTLCLLLALLCQAQVSWAETQTISKLKLFEKAVKAEARQSKNILVVLDIDDTLLTADTFYGGDTWYNWQRGREIKSEDGEVLVISEDEQVSCIFDRLTALYQFGHFSPTEPGAAKIFNKFVKKHDVLLLTSRSPAYRQGTERELARHKFDYNAAHLGSGNEGLIYDFSDGRYTAPVVYAHGIAMTSGLDKGKVLIDLLHKLNRSYETILFVDDGEKNITNMENAWQGLSTNIQSFLYQGVSKAASDEEIAHARQASSALDNFIQTAYPETLANYRQGQCN